MRISYQTGLSGTLKLLIYVCVLSNFGLDLRHGSPRYRLLIPLILHGSVAFSRFAALHGLVFLANNANDNHCERPAHMLTRSCIYGCSIIDHDSDYCPALNARICSCRRQRFSPLDSSFCHLPIT
jgi:hypothetical protein